MGRLIIDGKCQRMLDQGKVRTMSQEKASLQERDGKHLIHPLHNPTVGGDGHVWVKGEGAVLTDADGREFFDGLSGLWNVLAGHGRSELVEAASAQMQTLAYCSGYSGSSNPPAIALAERLAELTYSNINHFFFTSGGGESSESSFKLARYFWRLQGRPEKTKVISRQWGYHGVTLAAMSATGIASYWPMFEPRVPGFSHIPSPYPYRYKVPEGCKDSPGVAAANELEAAILREGPETVAMFLAEPVQGAGGVIVPQDDYFPRVREICDKYDVLLVADEVITGFGRTGKLFGLQHWGIEPDVIQFAKAITSGYFPFGGVGISDRVSEVLVTGDSVFMHAYTYSAHPVGCAVALRTIDLILDEDLPGQSADKGKQLLDGLRDRLGAHPHVGDIRGLGLMVGLELVADRSTKEEFPAEEKVGIRVHQATQDRGLFSRLRGDVFCLAPPAVTTTEQIDQIADIVADAVHATL